MWKKPRFLTKGRRKANEEETIEICINKALRFLKKNKINGEVLIADNGSIDNSSVIAKKLGAAKLGIGVLSKN